MWIDVRNFRHLVAQATGWMEKRRTQKVLQLQYNHMK